MFRNRETFIADISQAMDDVIKEFTRDVDNCYELDKVLKKALSRKNIAYKTIQLSRWRK